MVSNPATLDTGDLFLANKTARFISPDFKHPAFGELGYDLPIENNLQNPEVRAAWATSEDDLCGLLEARFPTNHLRVRTAIGGGLESGRRAKGRWQRRARSQEICHGSIQALSHLGVDRWRR